MTVVQTIPGYLTLVEAEPVYGIKADTLKRRCQIGKVIGAIKKGKVWFVPTLPNIDPQRPISENYPDLNFGAAYESNMSLYDAESLSRQLLHNSNKNFIHCWEYGYYFVSLIFKHITPQRNTLTLAAFITEAHSALRSSFLLNMYGYYADAYALLRRAHETTIKALAGKKEPQKIWEVSFSNNRKSVESIIGVNFKNLWKIECSFAHSNSIKLFETGINIRQTDKKVGVSYGPQVNNKLFRAAANTSLFWIYVLIGSFPYIFSGQISDYWLSKQKASAKFIRDYLIGSKALQKDVQHFDEAINKLIGK